MNIADDWHKNADAYLSYFDDNPDRISTRQVFPRILEQFGDVAGKRILDFGCGQGRFARMMAAAGAQVTAYDASTAEIENARRLSKDHKIRYLQTLDEVINAGPYDRILCFMVLICNPPVEADVLLHQLYDLIAPNGIVALGNTDTETIGRVWPDFYSTPPKRRERGAPYQSNIPTTKELIQITDYYYSPEHISNMLKQTGFNAVKAEKVAEPFVIHLARRSDTTGYGQ